MNLYIDFDDTILATEYLLFKEYRRLKQEGIPVDKLKHMQEFDWYSMLYQAEVIGDALEVLKTMEGASILTKIHSMENEGVAKIKYLREQGIKNDVILVPYLLKKSEVVTPYGNILIDDSIRNLDDWYEKGGVPIFFNKDGFDTDNWGIENKKYRKIRTLGEIKDIKF